MLLLKHRGKRQAGSSGDGEGSYLASASDLMIGLLFVFIILVVVLALEQRKQQGEMDDLKNANDPRKSVTEAIGKALKDAKVNVRVDPASGVISLPSDVLFGVGSATLGASARQSILDARVKLAEVLPCYVHSEQKRLKPDDCKDNPGQHEIDTIFLEGHTDNRPNPAPGGNLGLSFDRARAIQEVLLGSDSPLSNYRNAASQPIYSYSAYGDSRLLSGVTGDHESNRRVDMRIVLRYQSIQQTLDNIAQAGGGR
jgi:chemotaxis protein MotB